jgi:integrase
MTDLRTWGQALDYTFKTRHSWRHGNGAGTARINCGHFTRLRGLSFPIARITQPILCEVSIELEDEGKSDATINRIVSAVSTVLNHCAFDGLIPAPPKFRRRKEHEGRINFYTKEEVDQLYHSAIDPFMREDAADIVLVAAYTGMRQGELLNLKVKDVDLGLNVIHVGGRPDVVTKAGNYRSIPIHNHIERTLHQRIALADPTVRVFGDEWNDKDQLLRVFKKLNRFIGKDEAYVFHTLRHSFGTWCAEAGVPLRTIMDLMGHKRVETTLRYAKTTDKARTEALNLI